MAKARKASPVAALEQAESLLGKSAAPVRAETASIIGADYARGDMSERERRVAVGILKIMARDVEQQVREALSEQVKSCPFLPESLAKTLAADIESVALPVIEFSTVLSDTDLLAITDAGNIAKQMAIARRKSVSGKVSDRLVDTGNEKVVSTLLDNEGAEITEKSYGKVIDRFEKHGAIQSLMAGRLTLPLTIQERMISFVSVELRERIINRHDFPAELADRIVSQGRESALTRAMAGETRVAEVEGLISRLKSKGELSPSLILRALCEGDLHFFDAAVAALAGVSLEKARPFIYERGSGGLRMIFRNTGLPTEMFRAVKVAIEEINLVKQEQPGGWNKSFADRIVDRLVVEYDDLAPEGLENVLAQLSQRILGSFDDKAPAEALTDHRW